MAAVKNWIRKVSTTSIAKALSRAAGLGGGRVSNSVAVGVGVAVGLLPIVPLQSAVALLLALIFRLNRLYAIAGTMVCQPFTIPIIYATEYAVGRWVLGAPTVALSPNILSGTAKAMAIGGVLFACAGGFVAGAITYGALGRGTRQNSASYVNRSEGEK